MFQKKFENFSSGIDDTGVFFVKTAKIYEIFKIHLKKYRQKDYYRCAGTLLQKWPKIKKF